MVAPGAEDAIPSAGEDGIRIRHNIKESSARWIMRSLVSSESKILKLFGGAAGVVNRIAADIESPGLHSITARGLLRSDAGALSPTCARPALSAPFPEA